MPTTTARSDALVLIDLAALFLIALVTHGCSRPPAPTIYHLPNYHFVSRDDFAADLHDQDGTLTDAEIGEQYAKLLKDVEAVQDAQEQIRGMRRRSFRRKQSPITEIEMPVRRFPRAAVAPGFAGMAKLTQRREYPLHALGAQPMHARTMARAGRRRRVARPQPEAGGPSSPSDSSPDPPAESLPSGRDKARPG